MEQSAAVEALVQRARQLVLESGGAADFDAERWVNGWLEHPHPALGGRRPVDLMQSAEGRAQVSELLAQQQSGAYA